MLIHLCAAAVTAAAAAAVPGAASAATDAGCPAPTVTAATPARLATALADARPGDVIEIADGTYNGDWTATAPGTPTAPIWLCGGPGAVLTNDGYDGAYGLHLDGASWWHPYGFTVAQAKKGVVVDSAEHVTLERLHIHDVGDEGVHLRRNTTNSLITGNRVHDTGLAHDAWGEGVYIGSANVNWPVYTGGLPDRSDGNTVAGNMIYATTAEPVDVKEGTTGGLVSGNSLDAGALTEDGGDSCGDVKGNDWVISGNTCTGSPADGWQTHRKQGSGDWGLRADFTANTVDLAGRPGDGGLGFKIDDPARSLATVRCDNAVTGGAFANVPCTAPNS
ncbi:right-handed parallel beta-helix repeat-containing protein [Actinomadura rubrisoli]|uniref:Right handed beta helix domain-containing protein n=1 Tax=Actinomadura rubrisoli TaxID=2530368 RepID=A0A4R5C9F3_9ACTN|nr:right-handed parallel beta-helix repeat-containing protein [Actinomadura rubrisoli]TDD96458.1 hypothetical protein E1298_03190 [Actinomadura rubrisoli]